MSHTLRWRCDGNAVVFSCEAGGASLPINEWATSPVVVEGGEKAQPGLLLAMRDQAGVDIVENGQALRFTSEKIAAMDPWQARAVGLPPPPPYRIKLERSGLFTDRDFSLTYCFVAPSGQALPMSRCGPIAKIAGTEYTLHVPLFEIVTAVEALSRLADKTFEARAPTLERIQRVLSDEATGAIADQYVMTSTIASAESFTIRPRVDAEGTIDFDVKLIRESGSENEPFEHSLPEAREAEWNRHFRRLPLRSCYPAGAGHYVVVTPVLREALTVAKRMTTASPAQKREFVRNPRPFLREALPQLPAEALESVFWESAEYSARVRDIGLWQPRVLPFLKKSGIEWLPDETMGLTVGGIPVSIRPEHAQQVLEKLEEAQATGEAWIHHGDQRIPATSEAIAAARELAEIARTFGLNGALPTAERPRGPQETAGHLVLLIKDNLEDDGFAREWKPRANGAAEEPDAFATQLLDFQRDGYRWLQQLWTKGAPGALLADDMGLGKTLQTLAFLAWLRHCQRLRRNTIRPVLTVAPTGLLKNWVAEHDKHLKEPGLGEILQLHGQELADLRSGPRTAVELQVGVPTLDTSRMRSADWVLTTYETLRDYQHSFGAITWDVLVLDEAQKIKNPQTLLTEAAKAVNADFTIALTGTPVENRLADLWTIVDTVEPGRLGNLKDFIARYEPEGGIDQEVLGGLKKRLVSPDPPLLQRRTKKIALQGLPAISYHATRVPMPAAQAHAYESVVRGARGGTPGRMLQSLQDLRAVSLHPKLEMESSDDEFISQSARLVEAMRILDSVAVRREKALLFVDARAMQAALTEILQRRYHLSDTPLVINGDVPGARRLARAEEFQQQPGFAVLILSPRAGGVGLTITGANHVIHLGRWWNPAIEDQATDRVYRIGQDKPVHVYTPLAVHPEYGDASFDVRLDELLRQKRTLSHELLAPPEANKGDLENLLRDVVGA